MTRAKAQGAWTRRGVLRAAIMVGAVSAYAGLSISLQPTRRQKRLPEGETVLGADEYAILCALADRVCPAMGRGAPGALSIELPQETLRQLAFLPADAQQAMKLALRAVESPLLGVLTGERYRPFTQLSADEQDEVLKSFRSSSLPLKRTIYSALRGAIASLYYGDARTWSRLGYDGPPDPKALRAANTDLLVDYESLRGGA